jgi:hypothetical protein
MATYYYAYINSSNIVEQIVDLPTPIEVSSYISISSHDETLIGKRYNAETGEFEVVTWYCYAMLSEKDIVTQVIRRETALPEVPDNMIVIASYDESLVGKWYNRASGTFSDVPIHVLAEHSTDQINVGTQDLWLTDKLLALDGKLDRSVKCQIPETRRYGFFESDSMTKHYSFPFENPVEGYLPKYVFVQVSSSGQAFDDDDTVNMWLVRNGEDTDLYSLCRHGELINNTNAPREFKGVTNFIFYPKANRKINCFKMYSYMDTMTTRGGDAFVSFSVDDKRRSGTIGKFKYDANGVEFDIKSFSADSGKLATNFHIRAFAY